MKFGFEPMEASTVRGLVWAFVAVLGALGYFLGKDITPIILLGTAVAGGLGIGVKDGS
jgi:hypothetical protein